MTRKPVLLCILDGWGISDRPEQSAPALARTPALDALMASCPHATLTTFGPAVGLPEGQMGNSEVGHLTIGAGRRVWMDLGRIDAAIADGRFAADPTIAGWAGAVARAGGAAHLMGVVSDGGVHGHVDHLIAACRVVAAAGVPVVVHAITDGRDVAPGTAEGFLARLEAGLPAGARVGTVSGRYWAMDRDARWDRVARAWAAMARGEGPRAATPAGAMADARARGEGDEFVAPTVIGDHAGMAEGDGVFCLNFRADRAREILSALADPDFAGFETGPRPRLRLLGLVDYSERLAGLMATVFPKEAVTNALPAWIARQGLRQFHCAETEKYPHVTFFLAGGVEAAEPGEDRAMPRSPAVATYDLAPEMAAEAVTDRAVEAVGAGYDLIVVNYANPDMVGHTGDLAAAVRACEAVDEGLGRLVAALEGTGGALLVCADHGNCETMVDPGTGRPHTAHTLNPVPVVVWGAGPGARLRDGTLADVAPTLLALLGVVPPPEMTGRPLLEGPGATPL